MRQTRRSWWRVLAVLTALGLLAAACGDDGDEEGGGDNGTETTGIETGQVGEDDDEAEAEASYGGTIVVGLESETNDFNPDGTGSFANSGLTVAQSFFDPLVSLNAEGEFAPFLAESLESNDDLTEWTIGLRDGVVFHDGTPLDAETLKWNFDTLHFHDGSRNWGDLQSFGVTGMEVVDDMTVTYTLAAPNAAFPDLLRGDIGWPVSRQAYEADPVGFGSNPVGTGPFVFESWTRDDRLTVTRNENYWMTDPETGDQLPYLDGIEFRPITDDESRVQSLAADDIQVLQTLRGTSVKRVLDMVDQGGFDANLFVGNTSSITVINTLNPPLDDVRIRRAMAYANDQEQMAAVRDDDGLVPPARGFFSEDSSWYSEEAVSDYPSKDVDQAQQLIQEYIDDPERSDGKAAGEPLDPISYQCQPDPSLLEAAQLLQSLYSQVGIELSLEQVDQATMVQNVVGSADTDPPFRGNFMLTCFRAGGGDGDPLTSLQSFFGPVAETPGNFANFTDPEIDEALEQLRTSGEFEDRYAAVETISRIAAEEVPVVWNVSTPTLVGYREDVTGIPTWTLPNGDMGTGTPGGVARFHQTFLAE